MMFYSKKEIINDIQSLRAELAETNRKNQLLDYENESLRSRYNKLERLFKHSKKEIDFESYQPTYDTNDYYSYAFGMRQPMVNPQHTYIYTGNKEYDIKGLFLYEPIFSFGKQIDTIWVSDCRHVDGNKGKIKQTSYVIDLKNCTFIKTE